MVRVDAVLAMRSRNVFHATLLGRGAVERNPHRKRLQRLDRVIIAILVPGRDLADARRFAEYGNAPQDQVGSDQLLDHVENVGISCNLQPLWVSLDAIGPVRVEMRAEDEIGGKIGIVAVVVQQFLVEPIDALECRGWYPVSRRNDKPVAVICFDFVIG